MKAAALLIFLFSNQGYWLSGQDQTVSARWIAKDKMPAADLVWELGMGSVKLDAGTVQIVDADRAATISLKAHSVRVRTKLRWTYKVVQREGGKVLEQGEVPIHLFPADLTADWSKRVGEHRLVVCDDPNGLPKILEAAKVPFTRADDLAKILDRPDMILVGRERLDASPFAQSSLVNLAAAGSSIAVFEQTKPERLAGYPIGKRERPADLKFRVEHPLFARFDAEDLRAWTVGPLVNGAGESASLRPLQLPLDEPALELAWWPREVAGQEPSPIDSLLITKTTGTGRLVLCQLPLGAWDHDPRSQILMGNLLSYLSTRPEPTPPPSRRPEVQPATPQTVPTIDFR